MLFPTISIVNESTSLSDADLADIIAACQQQITNDFQPIWNLGASLNLVPRGTTPDTNHWWLVILNDTDDADALGYHDLTPKGQPLGKVFANADLNCGASISNTVSHELLEMLGDPSLVACTMNAAGTKVFSNENCDAVEADSLGYTIPVNGNDILVSDFVTPEWFNDAPGLPTDRTFDFMKHCTAPFQVLPGGYCGYLDLTIHPPVGWQEQTVDGRNIAVCKPAGSRFDRRRRFRGNNYRKYSTANRS